MVKVKDYFRSRWSSWGTSPPSQYAPAQFETASPTELRSMASSPTSDEEASYDAAEKYNFEYSQVHMSQR